MALNFAYGPLWRYLLSASVFVFSCSSSWKLVLMIAISKLSLHLLLSKILMCPANLPHPANHVISSLCKWLNRWHSIWLAFWFSCPAKNQTINWGPFTISRLFAIKICVQGWHRGHSNHNRPWWPQDRRRCPSSQQDRGRAANGSSDAVCGFGMAATTGKKVLIAEEHICANTVWR